MSNCPVWKVDPARLEATAMDAAAALVREGGVIVYPTETFYGLGGDPRRAAAIERIFQIKGRSFHKPLPLIASRLDSLRSAVGDWPSTAQKLADAFWPGPLTLILPAHPALPSMLHAQTGKIAVRVSSHPVATALAAAVGGLLISTSANTSGEPACSNPEDLSESLLHRVDGLLHGGRLPGGAPSTIVDVSVHPPRLVREGILPWDEVKNWCET